MAQTPFIGRHGLKSLGTLEVDGQSTFNDTVTFNSDIVQNGSTYETHAEQLFTKNDEVITRDGAVGALGAGEYSGFRVKLYDGVNDGRLVVGNDGIARVGDDTALQAIATREDSPVDTRVPYWDSATQSFKTDKGLSIGTDGVSSAKLRVKSTPTVEGIYLRYQTLITEDNTVAAGRGGGIAFGLGDVQLAGVKAYTPTASTDNSELRFVTKKAGVFSENMVLDENGNLGIGADSLIYPLHIKAINAFTAYTNNSDTGEAGILFRDTTEENRGKISYDFSNDNLSFRVNSVNDAVVIDASGNLDVVGDITTGSYLSLSSTASNSRITSEATSSNFITDKVGIGWRYRDENLREYALIQKSSENLTRLNLVSGEANNYDGKARLFFQTPQASGVSVPSGYIDFEPTVLSSNTSGGKFNFYVRDSGGGTTSHFEMNNGENRSFKPLHINTGAGDSLTLSTNNGAGLISVKDSSSVEKIRLDGDTGRISTSNNWQTPEFVSIGANSGVATTMKTVSQEYGFYNIYAYCNGGFNSSQVMVVGVLTTDSNGNHQYISYKTSTNVTVTLSGNNVQLTQTTGAFRTLYLTIQRIA